MGSVIMKSVHQELTDIQSRIDKLINNLCERVSGLPENDKIHVIPNNSDIRMFVVTKKDIGDCWSPEYHQFVHQYEALIDVFKHTRVENIVQRWGEIKANGFIDKGGKYKLRLHPTVISYVNEIIGE